MEFMIHYVYYHLVYKKEDGRSLSEMGIFEAILTQPEGMSNVYFLALYVT